MTRRRSNQATTVKPRRANPTWKGKGIYWTIFDRIPHDGEWYEVRRYQGEWGAKLTRDRIIYTHWHKHIRVPEAGNWEITAERCEPDENSRRGSVLYARWIG